MKVATKLTLPKEFLAKALLAKSTPLYAKESRFKGFSYEEDIYPQARLAFQDYNRLYDTNEKFTEYFARDLNRRNPQLLKQIATETPVGETQIQAGQETETEQAAPVGSSAGASAGGMPAGIPSLGSSASYRPSGRVVYNVPHAEQPEKPKIDIANRYGKVAEEPSKTIFTETKGGTITEHPIGPSSAPLKSTTPETPTIHLANSSGVVTKEQGLKAETPQPKLVIASKSGVVAEAPPSKIFIARSDGTVLREHAIKPMSRFSAFRSKVGGKIGGAAKAGLETANPFLRRAGNGLVNSLSSIVNPGGIGGGTGSRSILGRVSRFGRGGGGRSIESLARKAKKRTGLMFAFGVLGFMMLVGMIAVSGTPSTDETTITPDTSTPPAPTAPCTDGDYKTCLLANYKLDFQSGFPDSFLQMTYQALSSTETIAPKFKNLIHNSCPTIVIAPTTGTSHVSGCTANLKTTISQLTLIHELSHVIHNSNPSYYEGIITQARALDSAYWEGGFLTYYSKYASRPTDFSTNCYSYSTGEPYLLDEEFAESVTYFINSKDSEINMGPGCSVKWSGSNPYQEGARYQGHYNLIKGILR